MHCRESIPRLHNTNNLATEIPAKTIFLQMTEITSPLKLVFQNIQMHKPLLSGPADIPDGGQENKEICFSF